MRTIKKLDLPQLAGALDDAAATADALRMLGELAEEDEAVRRRLPVVTRSFGRLLEEKLTALAKQVD